MPKKPSNSSRAVITGKPTFVKEMVYADLNAFNNMWQEVNDPTIQKVMNEFLSYTVNLESKLIMEIM